MNQSALWDEWFSARYPRPGSRRLWAASGVETRHGVADPRHEDVSNWGTQQRMERYAPEALALSAAAAQESLSASGLSASEIDLLVVVSCTGYVAPGVDIMLARDLGMSSSLERLVIGHMGCHAALPALATVADAVVARRLTAMLVCVELPSLHLQPASPDRDQLVVHSLFGDAAAAAVVAPGGAGFEVVDFVAATETEHHASMTWNVTDLGFRMGLSPVVPTVLARQVGPVVDRLLRTHGLDRKDVSAWAIHPGGPRILDVCGEGLDLSGEALAASRSTLRRRGNCSSATILLVLDTVARETHLDPGAVIVAIAFGPGLTLYAALLRRSIDRDA